VVCTHLLKIRQSSKVLIFRVQGKGRRKELFWEQLYHDLISWPSNIVVALMYGKDDFDLNYMGCSRSSGVAYEGREFAPKCKYREIA
jgi:hypothetical protein